MSAKLYNSKEEKNAARRLRRKNKSPAYLRELEGARERRKTMKEQDNANVRNKKFTDPEWYQKRLASAREYKKNKLQENKQNASELERLRWESLVDKAVAKIIFQRENRLKKILCTPVTLKKQRYRAVAEEIEKSKEAVMRIAV